MKTEMAYFFLLIISLTWFQVAARGVNISSVWFLPEEGFPVFYRYFNDKVTWDEAEAVCGHHHADLLSVQTSAQMDATRAYLKEIDVSDNVWIGLHKDSPEKPFSWTNGEKLLDDGYWLEPIPRTNEKLCAALDPSSDFRWNAYYCGGSQVSSFVCELPVPEWAKKDDGCMISSLPSLTVTFIPEMEIVQLFSDCGLDGTRRIACKGGVNRDDLVRRLSCEEDVTTMLSKSTTDAMKDVMTQQSAWANDLKATHETSSVQGSKSRAARVPQTRHKRMASPPSASHSEDTKSPVPMETSTQTVMSTEKVNVLNLPSRNFPHSPADKNVPSTILPAVLSSTVTAITIENSTAFDKKDDKSVVSPNVASVPSLLPTLIGKLKNPTKEVTLKPAENITPSPDVKAKITEHISRPPTQSITKEVPVLIITSEASNDSAQSNTTTSENPPIVFMIEEKEGVAEPYLVPMGGDVIVNNPSLSPMEVIDVDLIELDNLTTTTTIEPPTKPTSPPTFTSTPQKTIIGIHPLRLGEKNIASPNTTTSPATITSPSTTTTTTTLAPTTTTHGVVTNMVKSTSVSQTEKPQQLSKNNAVEEDNDGEEIDMPQRPSRGRLITRSNIPSFYPYFFNKVLG